MHSRVNISRSTKFNTLVVLVSVILLLLFCFYELSNHFARSLFALPRGLVLPIGEVAIGQAFPEPSRFTGLGRWTNGSWQRENQSEDNAEANQNCQVQTTLYSNTKVLFWTAIRPRYNFERELLSWYIYTENYKLLLKSNLAVSFLNVSQYSEYMAKIQTVWLHKTQKAPFLGIMKVD